MPINYKEQTYCAGVLSVRVDAGAPGEAPTYSVLDSEGRVVATGIDCLERASLFAHAAPLLSYLAGAMEDVARRFSPSTASAAAEVRWLLEVRQLLTAAGGKVLP